MVKILLFSDTHFQNIFYDSILYVNNSKQTFKINDVQVGHYFYSIYKSFENVIYYVKKHDIDYVFHLGDVFHKDTVNTLTFNLVNELFSKLNDVTNISVWVMNGNHDTKKFDNKYLSKIYSLKNVHLVIDEPVILMLPNTKYSVVFMPYFEDTLKENYDKIMQLDDKNFQKSKKLLMAHHDFTEIFEMNNITVKDFDFSLKNIKSFFHKIYFGHWHKRQIINDDIHLIGSLNKTGGEVEQNPEYGICILNIDNDNIKTEYYNFNYFPYINCEYDDLFENDNIYQYCYHLKNKTPDCYTTLIIDVHRPLLFKEEFELKIKMKNYSNIIDRYKIRTFYDNVDTTKIKKIKMDSLNNIKSIFVNSVVKHLRLVEGLNDKDEIKKYIEYLKILMIESLEDIK